MIQTLFPGVGFGADAGGTRSVPWYPMARFLSTFLSSSGSTAGAGAETPGEAVVLPCADLSLQPAQIVATPAANANTQSQRG
jgi:hypothetical protein